MARNISINFSSNEIEMLLEYIEELDKQNVYINKSLYDKILHARFA